jgi:hypothetical protein
MAAKDPRSGERAPRFTLTAGRLARIAVLAAAVASVTALTRFALTKAIAGITEGGQRAASRSALWRLREVVIAEDAVRKAGLRDPDRDGIGSALLINELAGNSPVRGQSRLEPPLLNYRFRQRAATPLGDAVRIASHFFIVCLPTPSGGWTAEAGVPVDDERAERRFVAYAWPADGEVDVGGVYHIDEHERMLVYDESGEKYRGASSPPQCDAALGKHRNKWRPWEGKEPRRTLPGDLATKRPEP